MTSEKRFTPSAYHLKSAAEKRAQALGVREVATFCHVCDAQVMPDDLLAHIDQRCTGPREPGPGSKWVNWQEALALGIQVRTLTRWVRAKHVRFKGSRGDRLYLRRDLVKRLALRRPVPRR
jgi:hypothetical protein